MTNTQAIEIREHLIRELESNGFGDIVREINTQLRENSEDIEFQRSPRYLLDFFLVESINILDGLSNKNYQGLIDRFNEFTSGNNKVDTISVELLDQGEPIIYDLRELPDYKEIITVFNQVRDEIRREF
jgi:hypothetical protein